MFKVYKNGICVSGIFTRAYTDDPCRAYRWMEDMFQRRFFCGLARQAYELRSRDYIIDMGKDLPEAVRGIIFPTDSTDFTDEEGERSSTERTEKTE